MLFRSRRSLSAVDRGEWDVRAYQDHNPQLLLGTTKSKTLELVQDAKGLLARIRLNPEISFHRDLAAIVKVSTGIYRYDYNAATAGPVSYRWAGTSPAQAADQNSFFVVDDVGV